MELDAPFPWFGGKRRCAAEVWRRFGDVATRVNTQCQTRGAYTRGKQKAATAVNHKATTTRTPGANAFGFHRPASGPMPAACSTGADEMGLMQRRKGAAFERHVAAALRAAGLDAKRGLGQARGGGEVADVDLPKWWVECKHHKEPDPLAALEQAEVASDGRRPVAICRANRRTPTATFREVIGGVPVVVTIDFADWLAIVALEQSSARVL